MGPAKIDHPIPAFDCGAEIAAVPPSVAILDAYQSSYEICYVSNTIRDYRIYNKYFEGTEMNGVETLYHA